MRKSLCLITVILLLAGTNVKCQYYDTGEDPASLRWLQVKTGRFNVIYPEKYGSNGAEFARMLEKSYSQLTPFFSDRKFRIPVVIHSFSTQSNGYVAWAPSRMELYPVAEQNSSPGNQDFQLTAHEMTHVMQMESLNTGTTKLLSLLFGQQMTGIVSALLPLWYLEGDAVLRESLLSGSGRGRSPSFRKEMKAIAVTRGNYKYDKIINGSFRNYIPDHYRSGYQMVAWSAAAHDPALWNKVSGFTANYPFTINPVNISLFKNERLTKKRLYNETFDTLKKVWEKEASKGRTYAAVNPGKGKRYISYHSPVPAGKNEILAIRTSLSDPPAFVMVDPVNREEKAVYYPGYMYPYLLSCSAGRAAWLEINPDPRWANRDYMELRTMETGTGRVRTVAAKTRYFAVSVSPDGKEISAVENSTGNNNSLVILDAETGEIKHTVASPGNSYLQRPFWSEDGEKITVIYLTEHGEGIMAYSVKTRRWESLLEGREDLQSCFLRHDTLFYISSGTGTDNIFFKMRGRKPVQVTRSRFGTADISSYGNNLIFSDYTAGGNSVCFFPSDSLTGESAEQTDSAFFLIDRIKKPVTVKQQEPVNYTPVPYRKWQHPFRFHSWMPFYADIEQLQSDPLAIRPGFTILSQNTLSTVISGIGYEYSDTKRNVFHSRLTWKGWYPVVEMEYDYGDYPEVYGEPAAVRPGFRFTNTMSLPLQFSSGRFSQYIRPSVRSEYADNIYQTGKNSFDYYQLFFSGRLFISNSSRSAARDIFPRWAQVVDLNYYFAPWDKNIVAPSANMKTAFYFPGLFRNNGIRIGFSKEKKEKAIYSVMNRVSFPRGYDRIFSRELSLTTIDYAFPLAYPDFNLASFLYLKRLRSTLFYDQAYARNSRHYNPPLTIPSYYDVPGLESFRSYGIELLADFHLFRMPFMISGGMQSAWLSFNEAPVVKLLFNIDLYGFSIGRDFRR